MTKITPDERNTYERLKNQKERTRADERQLQYLEKKFQQEDHTTNSIPRNWIANLFSQWEFARNLQRIRNMKDIPGVIKLIVLLFVILVAIFIVLDIFTGAVTGIIEVREILVPSSTPSPTITFTPTPTSTQTPSPTFTQNVPTNTTQTDVVQQTIKVTVSPTKSISTTSSGDTGDCFVTSAVIAFVVFIVIVLREYFEKEREKEKRKEFEKSLRPLLRKRKLVCELCITAWKDKYDPNDALSQYAQKHSKTIEYQNTITYLLKEHIKKYHTWYDMTNLRDNQISYIIRGPSFWEKLKEG